MACSRPEEGPILNIHTNVASVVERSECPYAPALELAEAGAPKVWGHVWGVVWRVAGQPGLMVLAARTAPRSVGERIYKQPDPPRELHLVP